VLNSPHAEGPAAVYLPTEKIPIEADALQSGASCRCSATFGRGGFGGPEVNPSILNLYDNIQRLKRDVDEIIRFVDPAP